jgi:hypothetical protein
MFRLRLPLPIYIALVHYFDIMRVECCSGTGLSQLGLMSIDTIIDQRVAALLAGKIGDLRARLAHSFQGSDDGH